MKNWAFVFPGQGSQSVGMGRFLYNEFDIAKKTFEEASEALSMDVKKLCFESTEQELQLTANTQPALLTVSTATARVLKNQFGFAPQFTAGHSIGEYASLVLAEVMPFSTAMKAVRLRGESMQAASPAGTGSMMALMGPTESQVDKICQWANSNSGFGPIQAANFNSPGQIVISGDAKTLQYLKDNFESEKVLGETQRVKMIPLNVSAPFHSEMMKPAEEKMQNFFSHVEFQDAKIPVVQNLTAFAETKAEILKSNLIKQVSGSVRWMQSIENLKTKYACTQFVECGHGAVLKGLIKKTDPESQVLTTQSMEDLTIIESHLKAMGH